MENASKSQLKRLAVQRPNSEQQLAELLAAAKKIRPFIEDKSIPSEFWTPEFTEAITAFDAAINKIESVKCQTTKPEQS